MAGFSQLAATPDAAVEELALALARELRGGVVDADSARARLDALAGEVRAAAAAGGDQLAALAAVLGRRHGFLGEREEYDHPDNSMLDLVLERRRGLPIALSVVYVATARRAGMALDGVGLPGHYVVGRFEPGEGSPRLLDPFAGGRPLEQPAAPARPWGAHETALRMLNNLAGSYARRNDLARAIRAAELRLELPLAPPLARTLAAELRSLRARLN